VHLLVVVLAVLVLLSRSPTPQRLLDVNLRVLAADHEADLTRWVCWDGGETVFGDGEDLAALLLELCDERKMQPLAFTCG